MIEIRKSSFYFTLNVKKISFKSVNSLSRKMRTVENGDSNLHSLLRFLSAISITVTEAFGAFALFRFVSVRFHEHGEVKVVFFFLFISLN